jgi:hypothetical protein
VDALFPELRGAGGMPAESRSGIPEGDVWVHTLMVVDEARRATTTSTGRNSSR